MNFHFIFSIDATKDTGRYGRLVNHSRKTPNLVTKVITNGESPRLFLIAKYDIEPGVELLYDYGDRSKKSLELFPWLNE
jgi:histone-lysine N-methyltransferase SETD8